MVSGVSPPRVLLLDVMSTLVHDPFHVEVPAFLGMSLAELIDVKHPRAWVEFEHGSTDEDAFLSRFFADGRAFDGPGLKGAMRQAYRYLPGIEPLLHECYARGLPMHALSNYPAWYEMIEEQLALSRYVPWTFVSCNTGLRKPDPAVFEHVLSTLELPASACVLVDDVAQNCQAARDQGMDAIRFTDAAALRRGLVERGVL